MENFDIGQPFQRSVKPTEALRRWYVVGNAKLNSAFASTRRQARYANELDLRANQAETPVD